MKFSALILIGVVVSAAGWGLFLFQPDPGWLQFANENMAARIIQSADYVIQLGYMLITWGVINAGFKSIVAE